MASHLWNAAAADNKWTHFPKPQHTNEASFRDIVRKSWRTQRSRIHSGWRAGIFATSRNQKLSGSALGALVLSVRRRKMFRRGYFDCCVTWDFADPASSRARASKRSTSVGMLYFSSI